MPSSLLQVVNNLLQTCYNKLGTSSANTTCWQLVNRLVTTCLQTCNNLYVFTHIQYHFTSNKHCNCKQTLTKLTRNTGTLSSWDSFLKLSPCWVFPFSDVCGERFSVSGPFTSASENVTDFRFFALTGWTTWAKKHFTVFITLRLTQMEIWRLV